MKAAALTTINATSGGERSCKRNTQSCGPPELPLPLAGACGGGWGRGQRPLHKRPRLIFRPSLHRSLVTSAPSLGGGTGARYSARLKSGGAGVAGYGGGACGAAAGPPPQPSPASAGLSGETFSVATEASGDSAQIAFSGRGTPFRSALAAVCDGAAVRRGRLYPSQIAIWFSKTRLRCSRTFPGQPCRKRERESGRRL